MGNEVGERVRREGTYIYLWLIHVDIWQKPTQYCKANYPPLKKREFLLNLLTILLLFYALVFWP